jgi:hypothetical protein
MTTSQPPEFYFNGIDFNPDFFEDVSETLTKKESDARYLIKVEQDTATSLQTFTAGISTNNSNITVGNATVSSLIVNTTSLGSQTEGGSLDIASTQSTGVLSIGNLATRTGNINIATTKNTSSAQEIILGSSNALATGQIIRMNRPLNISYSAINDLQYTTSRIGSYVSNNSGELLATNNATASTTLTSQNVPAGEYMFHYQIGYRNTVATSTFTRQQFVLSTTINDFTNLIDDNTTLYLTNSTAVPISSPITDYTHRFCNSGSFVLSSTSDVYLNYRLVWTGTGVPYIKGFLKLIRIG